MSRTRHARVARRAGALALGVGLAAGLAACAPGGDPEPSGPVTLTWWDYYADGSTTSDALNGLLDEYQEANPDVTIDRQIVAYDDLKKTLLQSAGASSLPDIVVVNNPDHQQFAATGIAADLTDQLAEWGELDTYPAGSVASSTFEGRNYGLPITANCLALFYDKAALDAAGIEPPTTWDEMTAAAAALSQDGRYGLAFSAINNQQAVFQWLPTLWQSGGDLTELDSADSVAALQFWADLVADGSVSKEALNWDQAAVEAEFAQGRAAMMINGPWQIPALANDAPDLDYGVALLPEDKEAASVLGGENYLLTDGPNEAAAWELVKWLQQPEKLAELAAGSGSLPVRTDQEPFSDSDAIKVFTEQLQVARPRAYGANYAQIADQVVIAIQASLSGSTSAQDALDKAAAAVDPLLP